MAAAEIAPLAKVGGLADVLGSLPPALKKLGCDVRLVMPFYGSIKKTGAKIIKKNILIPADGKTENISLWKTNLPGTKIPIYLIENKKYFGKKEVYWGNNSERFLFFCLAVFHALPILKFRPDIVHCHDFHTALLMDIIKAADTDYYKNTKSIYTIHNLNYQGNAETEILKTGNLTKDSLKTLSRDAQNGDINFMVQGILNADLITTVSKNYAKEITTSVYGAQLDNIIRKRKKDLFGILNGIDMNFFNPEKDRYIKKNYSLKTLKNKAANKIFLQKKLGLQQNENIPLAAIVSRLAWQKGFELLTKKFLDLDCQFAVLGTGEKKYEDYFKNLAKKYPKKFSAQIKFSVELAQQIYAASDIFLMPSRFEPCGLGQMIAMRYGSVPVVRATGGLADTVAPLRKGGWGVKTAGFTFDKFTSNAFFESLKQALDIYYNKPKVWRRLQINGMKKDFSWDKSAQEYLKLYKKLAK
jgi:starch synthase